MSGRRALWPGPQIPQVLVVIGEVVKGNWVVFLGERGVQVGRRALWPGPLVFHHHQPVKSGLPVRGLIRMNQVDAVQCRGLR